MSWNTTFEVNSIRGSETNFIIMTMVKNNDCIPFTGSNHEDVKYMSIGYAVA